jgi:hypothetical protein
MMSEKIKVALEGKYNPGTDIVTVRITCDLLRGLVGCTYKILGAKLPDGRKSLHAVHLPEYDMEIGECVLTIEKTKGEDND